MRWSDEEIEILKKCYGKIPMRELCEELPNRSIYAIRDRARKRFNLNGNQGLSRRKYTFNTEFFSNLSVRNCYWAGFIAADGCIYDNANFSLTQSKNDKYLIYEFKKQVEYTGPIKNRICKTRFGICNSFVINICGAFKWKEDLLKHWNIVPRKSLILKPPNIIDKNFIYSFIIGYIDGDGSVSLYNRKSRKNKMFEFSIVGTKDVTQWICDNLNQLSKKILVDPSPQKDGRSNVYRVMWKGERAIEIHKYLRYELYIPWKLSRKWERLYK